MPCNYSSVFELDSITLSSGSATLNVMPGADLGWTGTAGIANDGTIVVNPSASASVTGFQFFAAGGGTPNSQINGSGNILLNENSGSADSAYIYNGNPNTGGGGTITHGADHLIHGAGNLYSNDNAAVFVNNSTIDADVKGGQLRVFLSLQTGNQNNGAMRATNGGTLLLENNGRFDQTGGGTIVADDNSNVLLGNIGTGNNIFVLLGGTLQTNGNGILNADRVSVDGVTNSGAMQMQPGGFLQVQPNGKGLINNGTILVNTSAANTETLINFFGNATSDTLSLNGSGSIQLNGINSGDAEIYNGNFNSGSGGTLTQSSTHLIHGRGDVDMSSGSAVFINNGTINADVNGSQLRVFFSGQSGNQNNGTMEANNGGTLSLQVGQLTNNGTITPGLSPGQLNYSGTLNLGSASNLLFVIDGLGQGTQYDWLNEIDGAAQTLGGSLTVRLTNGFIPQSQDVFTIVTTQQVLQAAFTNVASGARLITEGGEGSFVVNYSGTNNVTLSDFLSQSPTPTATPTPSGIPRRTPTPRPRPNPKGRPTPPPHITPVPPPPSPRPTPAFRPTPPPHLTPVPPPPSPRPTARPRPSP